MQLNILIQWEVLKLLKRNIFKMIHIFINNNSYKTIILLHGTGADEYDLIPVAQMLDQSANILSFRGNVIENGMNRFFKRFSIGKYDLESYKKETKNLVDQINSLIIKYNIEREKVVVAGFSNGANIALGILQYYPNTINNYILFSPDYIDLETNFLNLNNKKVFLSTAINDPYSNYQNLLTMKDNLKNNNANVTYELINGHTITKELILMSKNYFKEIFK